MNVCPKCGYQRKSQDIRCPRCGVIYDVYNYYISQQRENKDKEPQKIICPSCGESVPKDSNPCPKCDALLCFDTVTPTCKERIEKLGGYSFGQILLREREYIFEKIYNQEELDAQIRYFSLYALMFSAGYGLFLGMFSGNLQIIASLIKVPILMFGTLLICLPVLYLLNTLIGYKLTLKQTLTLLVASAYMMSIILVGVSPILLLFIFITELKKFISLLNMLMFVLSGFFSLRFVLCRGMRYLTRRNGYRPKTFVIRIWLLVYVIIGTQLAWILRPFIGEKGNFVLFRKVEGNFFLALFNSISDLLK
ncbi:MAG: hypothetical protein BWK80_18890 [Desulfobacteraceae bacterium IS3]|nr:MAG: hypothetical protein BWK80_18890 [Desulfobacteraceae bacterium IS3]